MKKVLVVLSAVLCTVMYGDILLDGSWKIVLPPKTDRTVTFAAEDLQYHVGKITGKRPQIVPYAKGLTKAVYLKYVPKIDPERWMIRTDKKNIYISGGYPRGVQYGVYELLERYGNCRFFTPKCSRVPKAKAVRVPVSLNIAGEPWFLHRFTAWTMNFRQASPEEWQRYFVRTRYGMDHFVYRREKDPIYRTANRLGSPGMTHTFYGYQKDWKDVKPEYYALLKNGKRAPRMTSGGSSPQFCLTNRELRERFFQQILTFIRKDREKARKLNLPNPIFYALSPNDNTRYCQCAECRKKYRAEKDVTDTYVDFICEMANRLKKIHPEVILKCSGYQSTKNPPSRTLPDNVLAGLAFLDSEYLSDENADVTRPLTHPSNKVAYNFLQGWRKKAPGGVVSHQYAAHFTLQYRVPCDVTRKLDKDLKMYKKYGARSMTMEMYDRDGAFFWLRRYVLGKLAYDPDLDLMTLVKEFIDTYYGPAAKPMLEYYNLLADSTEKEMGQLSQTPLARICYLTEEFFRKSDALLDQAEKLAGKDQRVRHAVEDERMVLDMVRIYNYDQMKVKLDRDMLRERYLRVKERMGKTEGFYGYRNSIHHAFLAFGGIECERAILKEKLPAKFRNRNAYSWFAVSEHRRGGKVKDPEAAGGIALKLGRVPYQRKLRIKLHDRLVTKDLHKEVHVTTFPKDEKYHWYYVHTADLYPGIIFWTNLFENNLSWANLPPPGNRMEIHVSLKFTGPTFVPGSKKPDGIYLDRIIAVPPLRKK